MKIYENLVQVLLLRVVAAPPEHSRAAPHGAALHGAFQTLRVGRVPPKNGVENADFDRSAPFSLHFPYGKRGKRWPTAPFSLLERLKGSPKVLLPLARPAAASFGDGEAAGAQHARLAGALGRHQWAQGRRPGALGLGRMAAAGGGGPEGLEAGGSRAHAGG